jgi:hypothetical protein
MTAAASVPLFRRYRVLSIMVLVLTVVSIIQINSGGIGKNLMAEHITSIGECLKDEGYAATLRVLCTYKGYNVVRFGQSYFVLAQDLGAVDLSAIMKHEAPRPPATKFMVASDVSGLKAILERFANADEPPKLLYDFYGYNVLHVGQFYVAVSQALGDINVVAVLTHTVASPPPERFIVAHDLWSLKGLIIYTRFKLAVRAVTNAGVVLLKEISSIRSKLHV